MSGNGFGPNAGAGAGNGFGPNRSTPLAGSGGGTGPLAPSAFTSLAWWLEHGIGVTHIAGKVTAWLDSSGSGDPAKNAIGTGTLTNRPTYNAVDAAWNNLPSVTLAKGNAEYLFTGTWATALLAPFTVVLLGESDNSSEQGFFDDVNTELNAALLTFVTGVEQLSDAGGSNNVGEDAAVITSIQSPCFLACVFNGENSAMYINNPRCCVPVSTFPTTTPLTGIVLGSFGGAGIGSSTLNGKVFEACAFDAALTPIQVNQLFQYYNNLLGGIL